MKIRGHNLRFLLLMLLVISLPSVCMPSNGHVRWKGDAGVRETFAAPGELQKAAVWDCRSEPFRENSHEINDDQKKCLDSAVSWLKNPDYRIIIEGHRNPEESVGVSLLRANAARDYLINQKGVAPGRILVRNFCANCRIENKEAYRNSRIEVGIISPSTNPSLPRFTISRCLNMGQAITCDENPPGDR